MIKLHMNLLKYTIFTNSAYFFKKKVINYYFIVKNKASGYIVSSKTDIYCILINKKL